MSLFVHQLETLNEREKHLKKFNPDKQTWVVSDLSSQNQLRRRFCEEKGALETDKILRVKEFWDKVVERTSFPFEWVPEQVVESILWDWVRDQKKRESWLQHPGEVKKLTEYMSQFVGIFSHPEGHSLLKDWMDQNSSPKMRWGKWLDISFEAWNFLKTKKVMSRKWSHHLLLYEDISWEGDVVVDLGFEIEFFEAQLFEKISEKGTKVDILKPSKAKLYSYLHMEKIPCYKKPQTFDLGISPPPKTSFKRFSSALGEVKDAISHIRIWIDEGGLNPKDIAVVAPNMKDYEEILTSYLEEEGIPFRRKVTSKAHGFKEVSHVLSYMRYHIKDLKFSDMESLSYNPLKKAPFRHDRFKRRYGMTSREEDLKRGFKRLSFFKEFKKGKKEITKEEFFLWALEAREDFRGKKTEVFESVMVEFLKNTPLELSLPFESWLQYFEKLCSQKDIEILEGDKEGIYLENLRWIKNLRIKKCYILGLCDEDLVEKNSIQILENDVLTIHQDLDFNLPLKNTRREEMELQWLFTKKDMEFVLSFSEANFLGEELSPHWIWLKGASQKKLSAPLEDLSCWDQRQRRFEKESKESKTEEKLFLTSEALGKKSFSPLPSKVNKVSISSLGDFHKCPFVFASKKVFLLKDSPPLEDDLSPMDRGSFSHYLMEKFIGDEEVWKEELLEKKIDKWKKEYEEERKEILFSESLWPAERKKLVKQTLNFQKMEEAIRASGFSLFQKEMDFSVGWNYKEKKLVPEEKGDIIFRGKIDRVDRDEKGNYLIYDYKSTASSCHNLKSWTTNREYQLGVYAQILKEGLQPDKAPQGEVLGCLYYTFEKGVFEKGFINEGLKSSLGSFFARKKFWVSKEDLEKELSGLNESINEDVLSISRGEFNPSPSKEEDCVECDWRNLCRANHLT